MSKSASFAPNFAGCGPISRVHNVLSPLELPWGCEEIAKDPQKCLWARTRALVQLHTASFAYSALGKLQNENPNTQKYPTYLVLRSGKVYLIGLQILPNICWTAISAIIAAKLTRKRHWSLQDQRFKWNGPSLWLGTVLMAWLNDSCTLQI